MEKVTLALNYALMLEMMKAKGYNNTTIIELLNEGNEEILESIGEGIPDWKTLVEFYNMNQEKCLQAINGNYEIGFLTKGALKSLLTIKFGMEDGKDFVDTGEFLDQVKITNSNLASLREVISKNWTIVLLGENSEDAELLIQIELTHKPVFNL